MILFTFSFDKRIQSHPAATPIKILHPTEIQTALTAPGIPVVLINGENANDKSVGAIVLLINEQIPNTPPRIAPAAGPNKIAPIITGMCTVVALMIGSCIIPSGVFARTITIAATSATLTIQLVLCFFVFMFNLPPCYHSRYPGYNTITNPIITSLSITCKNE